MTFSGHFRGTLLVLLSSVLFASYGIWSKLLGLDFGIFYQGWVRSLIVLIILIPIAVITHQWGKIERKDYRWILIPVLFGAATQAPLYYAFVHAGIGISSVIFFTTFLLMSYAVGWLLGEDITRVKVTSFLLALVGLVLTFGLSIKEFAILALLAAALNGVASGGEVSTTKKVTGRYSSLQISIFIWIGIVVTNLPASLLLGEPQLIPEFSAPWLAMLLYAVAGVIGFWAVVEGFKYIDASIGSLVGLFEIVFGIMFGVIFFSESVTPSIVVGSLLILVAAALPYLLSSNAKNPL